MYVYVNMYVYIYIYIYTMERRAKIAEKPSRLTRHPGLGCLRTVNCFVLPKLLMVCVTPQDHSRSRVSHNARDPLQAVWYHCASRNYGTRTMCEIEMAWHRAHSCNSLASAPLVAHATGHCT